MSIVILVLLALVLLAVGHAYTVWMIGSHRARAAQKRVIADMKARIAEAARLQRQEFDDVPEPAWPWVPCGYCQGQRRVIAPHPFLPGRKASLICPQCVGVGTDMHPPADSWPEEATA